MTRKEEVLRTLRALKPEIKERYKVRDIGLFGSFVRDEQGVTSDIDILVDFDEDAELFDLVGLSLFLEERLHRRVDVVSKRALRAEIRDSD
jgi:predicted nucleotidyltransferase